MRTIHLLIFLLIGIFPLHAQETKARVNVTAIGVDIIEAKNLALRSAIEQAFGAYISSNTEILNDELIKDEIISISSGNIDSIHVTSETKLVDGRTSVSLLAVVSVNKLVTFCESKGYKVEFKGGLFSINIQQQKLNETAELRAIENICEVGKSIINKAFDYSLTISEPQQVERVGNEEIWELTFSVLVKPNANFIEFKNFIYDNLSRIAMNQEDVERYRSNNKQVYNVKWVDPSAEQKLEKELFFRNLPSLALIQDLFWHAKFSLGFFEIASNVDTVNIFDTDVFPQQPEFTSNIPKGGYVEEFLEIRACLPIIQGDFVDLSGYTMPNFGIGKIYKLRSDFFKEELSSLKQFTLDTVYRDYRDSLYRLDQIQRINTNLKNFYKEKYIFVLQDDNSRGVFEDLWQRGKYIDQERDYLKVYLGLDLKYIGQYQFRRSFALNDLEKITSVEVFPSGRTMGL
jgi:hypothetical protein